MNEELQKIISVYREVELAFADEFVSSLIRYIFNELEEDLTNTINFVETNLDILREIADKLDDLLNSLPE